jgi:ubiquinone/menaquinone biosynthesis C-methylase UbiE
MARYVIQGGQGGYDRLRLLARTRMPDTNALFDRVGVQPGWRCLDLGCGSGDVAFHLARLVGATGLVDGIDADDVQLSIVDAAARDACVSNLRLRCLDISDWISGPDYDLVYARFVLQHLPDPLVTLSRMWAAVRPGGALVVEDTDFAGLVAYPQDDSFDFYGEHYSKALAANGGDPTIGQKLYGYFTKVGVTDVDLRVTQAVYVGDDEGKLLPPMTLRTTAAAIVDAGLASADAVERAIGQLAIFASRTDSMLSGPRIFQLWGRRASGPAETATAGSPPRQEKTPPIEAGR